MHSRSCNRPHIPVYPEGLYVTYLLGTPPACMNQSGSGEPEPTSHCEHFPEFPKKVVQIVHDWSIFLTEFSSFVLYLTCILSISNFIFHLYKIDMLYTGLFLPFFTCKLVHCILICPRAVVFKGRSFETMEFIKS